MFHAKANLAFLSTSLCMICSSILFEITQQFAQENIQVEKVVCLEMKVERQGLFFLHSVSAKCLFFEEKIVGWIAFTFMRTTIEVTQQFCNETSFNSLKKKRMHIPQPPLINIQIILEEASWHFIYSSAKCSPFFLGLRREDRAATWLWFDGFNRNPRYIYYKSLQINLHKKRKLLGYKSPFFTTNICLTQKSVKFKLTSFPYFKKGFLCSA